MRNVLGSAGSRLRYAAAISDASSFSDDERNGSDHEGLDGSSGHFDRDEEAFDCRLDALIRAKPKKM